MQDRILDLEKELGAVSQKLDQSNRLIAAIKGRDTDGAMNFQGEWAYVDYIDFDTTTRSAYIDQINLSSPLEHAYFTGEQGSGGHIPFNGGLLIPWAWSGDGTGVTDYHIKIRYDAGDGQDQIDFAFGVGNQTLITGLLLNGETGMQEYEKDSYWLGNQPPLSPAGTVSTIAISGGNAHLQSGIDVLEFSTQVRGSSQPTNFWRPGAALPGDPTIRVGNNYNAGDVVSYKGNLWIAQTDTDTNAPVAGEQWKLFNGSLAGSFGGEWSAP